jgi:uncharacterized protein (DUF2141 family)
MALKGMNIAWGEQANKTLTNLALQFSEIGRQVNTVVEQSRSEWLGEDQQQFDQWWQTVGDKSVSGVVTELNQVSGAVRRNTDEQVAASS